MIVKVYWNSHKKCWSVKSKDELKHLKTLSLEDVVFKIYRSGQARARREHKKNVHAFAIGTPIENKQQPATRVLYNPYKNDNFITEDGEDIFASKKALFTAEGKVFVS